MKFFYGCLFFTMVLLASMLQVYIVAVPMAALFTYWYDGRVTIAAALVLDAYYGAFSHLPWFSIIALSMYVVVEILSPRLRRL